MIMKNDAKIEEQLTCQFKNGCTVGTEYWCKILWKNDLCIQNSPDKFEKLLPEILKVSKLGLWWDSFIQSRKCMSLKFS